MELIAALYKFCDLPFDGKTNFDLAYCYEDQKQLASAFGYYLRAAQHSNDNLLIYESLLRAAFCFEQQGERPFSTKHLFEYAIGAAPERPEAYYHICRFLEWSADWAQILLFASVGYATTAAAHAPPLTDLNYPGAFALKFYRALSLYHLGDAENSLKLFAELSNDKTVDEFYEPLVKNNVSYISTLSSKNYAKI